MRVATPCIGLCSTTLGDLVCRGCKRYIHEIVGWNGFTVGQQRIVIARLDTLREESFRVHAVVIDAARLDVVATALRMTTTASDDVRAFEVLRRTAHRWQSLHDIGCRALGAELDPPRLRNAIETEFLQRSQAHYEHDFRVPAGP